MSWDFSMERTFVVKNGLNYTWNVSAMYADRRVFGKDGISSLDGLAGKEAFPILRSALAGMKNNAGKLKRFEPENKWGSFDGAVKIVETLIEWCLDEPNAVIRIW